MYLTSYGSHSVVCCIWSRRNEIVNVALSVFFSNNFATSWKHLSLWWSEGLPFLALFWIVSSSDKLNRLGFGFPILKFDAHSRRLAPLETIFQIHCNLHLTSIARKSLRPSQIFTKELCVDSFWTLTMPGLSTLSSTLPF
jgi:hypothetical protein